MGSWQRGGRVVGLPKVGFIKLDTLDLWFSNVVDAVNYDLGKIENAVPALNMVLTNIDTAPIQYLKDSLDELVKNINTGFDQIDDRLKTMEAKIAQGGK